MLPLNVLILLPLVINRLIHIMKILYLCMQSYKILGVDPGTNILGYSVIQVSGDTITLLDLGVMKLQKLENHQTKLKEIFLQLQEVIETYLPKSLAIEAPFFGKNVQSMLKLGRAQGVCMAAAMTMGVEITEYSPKKIKQSITGNGNASKEQVHAMLEHILKHKIKTQYLDASDALATAICHYNQLKNPAAGQKSYGSWGAFLAKNPEKLAKL